MTGWLATGATLRKRPRACAQGPQLLQRPTYPAVGSCATEHWQQFTGREATRG
jgi:hypothetical protein